jgi:hypothetical protein
MADPPRSPETEGHSDRGLGRGPARSTPRGVIALGIVIAIGLFVLIVLLHVTGTIGPGAH